MPNFVNFFKDLSAPIHILGLMSGSSLDGVDMAICSFTPGEDGFPASWEFAATGTRAYPGYWHDRLATSGRLSLPELLQMDSRISAVYAQMINDFLSGQKQLPHAVSIHGHTVLHKPECGYSLQLGSGAYLAGRLDLPVISQLRDADMEAGGQGAPLAPLADQYLFPGYEAYLNIGGIANVHIPSEGKAYDTGAANQLLNALARKMGQDFDEDGRIAATGNLLPGLLEQLNTLDWFNLAPPKSLANQWVQHIVQPIISRAEGSIPDKLHTVGRHIAWHIGRALQEIPGRILVSGGGAHNRWLIDRIRDTIPGQLIIPEKQIIDFKEAALVALIGYLRLSGKKPSLARLTGARIDTIPGALYLSGPALI